MEWLTSLAASNGPAVTIILVTLGLVVALIFLVWVFRKIAGSNAIRTNRNRRPRLAVTDAAVVDDKRRLVLVRRDDVEHLVMIGGASDVVVETNIIRTQAVAVPNTPAQAQITEPDPPADAPVTAGGAAGGAMAAGGAVAAGAVAASTDFASSTAQAATETVESVTPTKPEPVPEPEAVEVATIDDTPPAPPEPAVEPVAAIAPQSEEKTSLFDQSLEDALQIDLVEPTVTKPVEPVVPPAPKPTSVEDEMQRLLNELSTEKA